MHCWISTALLGFASAYLSSQTLDNYRISRIESFAGLRATRSFAVFLTLLPCACTNLAPIFETAVACAQTCERMRAFCVHVRSLRAVFHASVACGRALVASARRSA
eukprot:IDg16265t1